MSTVTLNGIDLELDPRNYRAVFKGQELPLTAQQFSVLFILAQNPDHLITHQQLSRNLWPTRRAQKVPARNLIKTVIHHIRERLAAVEPGAENLIETRHGLGYQLRAGTRRNGNAPPAEG